jgi:hypothetical protein
MVIQYFMNSIERRVSTAVIKHPMINYDKTECFKFFNVPSILIILIFNLFMKSYFYENVR